METDIEIKILDIQFDPGLYNETMDFIENQTTQSMPHIAVIPSPECVRFLMTLSIHPQAYQHNLGARAIRVLELAAPYLKAYDIFKGGSIESKTANRVVRLRRKAKRTDSQNEKQSTILSPIEISSDDEKSLSLHTESENEIELEDKLQIDSTEVLFTWQSVLTTWEFFEWCFLHDTLHHPYWPRVRNLLKFIVDLVAQSKYIAQTWTHRVLSYSQYLYQLDAERFKKLSEQFFNPNTHYPDPPESVPRFSDDSILLRYAYLRMNPARKMPPSPVSKFLTKNLPLLLADCPPTTEDTALYCDKVCQVLAQYVAEDTNIDIDMLEKAYLKGKKLRWASNRENAIYKKSEERLWRCLGVVGCWTNGETL